MEQSQEVEDVVYNFAANMRYITWKPKQLARHLGDPDYTGPREWMREEVHAPLDVAQAVHDFMQFITVNPLPHIPHRHRQGAVIREEVAALSKLLYKYMYIVNLTPTQVAYHCRCSPHAVRGWRSGWASPPDNLLTAMQKWAQYIQDHPFPQYRKGTHGGARYRRTSRTAGCVRVLS